jgi:Coenzyme PQQ synthesis protein D (PqqD)
LFPLLATENRRTLIALPSDPAQGSGKVVALLAMPPHIRSIVDPDGAAILDIQQNVLITLNPSGAYIWSKLQAGKPVDEIIAELSRDTGEAVSVIQRDVQSFITQLIAKQLVNH